MSTKTPKNGNPQVKDMLEGVEGEELESVDVSAPSITADNVTYERLQSYSLPELRRIASVYYRMRIDREWTKDDIINAIMKKREKQTFASPAIGERPPPGRARIRIFPDTSGTGNPKAPVYVNLNGYELLIPRDVEVDVPCEIVSLLKDARAEVPASIENVDFTDRNAMRASARRTELWVSYPFEVVASNPLPPGQGLLSTNARSGKLEKIREQFLNEFGYWPSDSELKDYIKELRQSRTRA